MSFLFLLEYKPWKIPSSVDCFHVLHWNKLKPLAIPTSLLLIHWTNPLSLFSVPSTGLNFPLSRLSASSMCPKCGKLSVVIRVYLSEAFNTVEHFFLLSTCVLLSCLTLLSPGFHSIYQIALMQAPFLAPPTPLPSPKEFIAPGTVSAPTSFLPTLIPYVNSSSSMTLSMCYLPSTLVYRPDHSLEYQSYISNCFLDLSSFMLVGISSLTFLKHILIPSLQLTI